MPEIARGPGPQGRRRRGRLAERADVPRQPLAATGATAIREAVRQRAPRVAPHRRPGAADVLLGIDHVVLAVDDPDAAAAELEAKLGLAATGGGRHEALGTFNRLVWLGDSYLELIGVFDRELAARELARPAGARGARARRRPRDLGGRRRRPRSAAALGAGDGRARRPDRRRAHAADGRHRPLAARPSAGALADGAVPDRARRRGGGVDAGRARRAGGGAAPDRRPRPARRARGRDRCARRGRRPPPVAARRPASSRPDGPACPGPRRSPRGSPPGAAAARARRVVELSPIVAIRAGGRRASATARSASAACRHRSPCPRRSQRRAATGGPTAVRDAPDAGGTFDGPTRPVVRSPPVPSPSRRPRSAAGDPRRAARRRAGRAGRSRRSFAPTCSPGWRAGRGILRGIVGYDESVIPAVENAIIAGQDLVFLGERGQAKTRMARLLVDLLDEWLPVVRGGELNDDPVRPDQPRRPGRRRRARRRDADRLAAARPALRGEARDARHHDRRPDRRGRPDPRRRGPLPQRRADAPLRPDPAREPGHLRDQRAARPRRADPGRPAQHPRGARRPDPRLPGPPAARPVRRRVRQPRGLHEPRPDHHAAQGPPRDAGPDALPADPRRTSWRSSARRSSGSSRATASRRSPSRRSWTSSSPS